MSVYDQLKQALCDGNVVVVGGLLHRPWPWTLTENMFADEVIALLNLFRKLLLVEAG